MEKLNTCKECPWVVRNNHNNTIVNFSKRMDKSHNCHMINGGKDLWNVTERSKCNGRKHYESLVSS